MTNYFDLIASQRGFYTHTHTNLHTHTHKHTHTHIKAQSTAVSYLLLPYIPHNILYHISHTHKHTHTHTESLKVS